MKKVAENRTYDEREYIPADHIQRTNIIVWLGSSEYWANVYLNTNTGRLMVQTEKHWVEPLDKFNIRKVGDILHGVKGE